MAHEIADERGRIIQDRSSVPGPALVRGTEIPVEQILATLASTLDVDALFQAYPELTPGDVRAVLSYARERVRADDIDAPPADTISPQDFYADMTRRPDVSELLRRLAR
jgi:uncharacterized protein (DUF433 family)